MYKKSRFIIFSIYIYFLYKHYEVIQRLNKPLKSHRIRELCPRCKYSYTQKKDPDKIADKFRKKHTKKEHRHKQHTKTNKNN